MKCLKSNSWLSHLSPMISLIICHGYTHRLHSFQKVVSLPLSCFRYVAYVNPNNTGQVMISSYMFPPEWSKWWWKNRYPPINSVSYHQPSASEPRYRFIALQPTYLWPQTTPLYRQTTAIKSSSVSLYTVHACCVYHSIYKIPFWIKVVSPHYRLTKCMFGSCASEFDDGKILSEDWAQACGNRCRCSHTWLGLTGWYQGISRQA